MTTKKAIFEEHLAEWLEAEGDRKKRGEMIERISRTAKVHSNSVGRSFKRIQMAPEGKTENRGRKIVYGKDVDAALCDIWEASNQSCGELLHAMINEYVEGFKKVNRWKHNSEATQKLLSMSLSTVKRRCKSLRNKHGINRGMSSTKPSSLKSIIPIFKGPWDDLEPGNGQIDTVAHCGLMDIFVGLSFPFKQLCNHFIPSFFVKPSVNIKFAF